MVAVEMEQLLLNNLMEDLATAEIAICSTFQLKKCV